MYLVGEYAYPGFNAMFYAIAFAIVLLSSAGFYNIIVRVNRTRK